MWCRSAAIVLLLLFCCYCAAAVLDSWLFCCGICSCCSVVPSCLNVVWDAMTSFRFLSISASCSWQWSTDHKAGRWRGLRLSRKCCRQTFSKLIRPPCSMTCSTTAWPWGRNASLAILQWTDLLYSITFVLCWGSVSSHVFKREENTKESPLYIKWNVTS